MKKLILLLLAISLIMVANSFATIRSVTVQNYVFTPSTTNAFVGDTIHWTWINGTHTTTSVNVPLGAVAWNNPMDLSNTSFNYVILVPGTYNYQCYISRY